MVLKIAPAHESKGKCQFQHRPPSLAPAPIENVTADLRTEEDIAALNLAKCKYAEGNMAFGGIDVVEAPLPSSH